VKRGLLFLILAVAAGPLVVGRARLGTAGEPESQGQGDRSSVRQVAEQTRTEVPRSRAGTDLIGKPAPEWGELAWLNSTPLTLKELRGKVVLVRFWTNTCPFCEATAPALRRLHQEFAGRGLVVIGMYHPKPPGARRSVESVRGTIQQWGWQFPVGLDSQWQTLQAFWLNGPRRPATSASFLVDRRGVIRFVHPGPEYHPDGPPDHQQCRDDYRDLRRAIEALLSEQSQAARA
jgi:thiol-disulfide isomerase/thioredoxin